MPRDTKLSVLLQQNASPEVLREYFVSLLEEEILITCFNNKGGVGKSSSCAELAVIFAQHGLKVLVVDADGQGSLSARILHCHFVEVGREALGDEADEMDEQMLADKGEDVVRTQVNLPKDLGDIYAFFNSVFSRPANIPEFNRSVNRVKLFEMPLNRVPDGDGGVSVLIGDAKLGLLDSKIATTLNLGAVLNNANISAPGALPMALRNLAREQGFDIVLIDINPVPTSLNQCLVMGANYMIVPYLADFSSLRAVKNVQKILEIWEPDIVDKGLRYTDATLGLDPSGYFPVPPKLLGAICHRMPAKIPNACQGARAAIIQQLVALAGPEREGVSISFSSEVSEGSSTAIAAGLNGVPLSDITNDAARKIHNSEVGRTINRGVFETIGKKIRSQYLGALEKMIAAMSPSHQERLGIARFQANLLVGNDSQQQASNEPLRKKRHRTVDNEILLSVDNHTRYQQQIVRGDGNCSLTALGVARSHFCDVLARAIFEGEGEGEVRRVVRANANHIWADIKELFVASLIPGAAQYFPREIIQAWSHLERELDKQTQMVGVVRAKLRDMLPEEVREQMLTIHSEEAFYQNGTLAGAANAEIRQCLHGWTQAREQETGIDRELKGFFRSLPVQDLYFAYLREDGHWIGMHTMVLYARVTQQFSLFIHQQAEFGRILPAELYAQFTLPQPNAEERHLLFNGRDHFNRLIKLQPEQQQLPQPPQHPYPLRSQFAK